MRDRRGEIIGASKVARDVSLQRENQRLLSSEADALAKLNEKSSRLWQLRNLNEGLDEILAAVIELLDADLGNIQLLDAQGEADLPAEAVRLEADPVRLAQVFSNLLINAAKYTDPNGHIELRAVQEGDAVVVTIRDDGIGISKEMMPRLFTIFSQAHPALERSEGGLGVGLSLVRGLVALHGGQIEARSEGADRGSEFIVRLPMGDPSAERFDSAAGADVAPAAALKLVVVDDNRDAAESCAMLLELSGHHVRTTFNARQALEVAARFRPDAFLLDIGLPDITGYELARQIRAAPWGLAAVLIAVTGWGQEEDRRRAFEAGFDHHLTKPIEGEKLESLLHTLAETILPASRKPPLARLSANRS